MIEINKKYSHLELIESMKILSENYHPYVTYEKLGESHDLREIGILKVGNGEQELLFTGGVHGRESINPVVLLFLVEQYAKSLEEPTWLSKKYLLSQLFRKYTLSILPLVNPDGYMIAQEGFEAINDSSLRGEALLSSIPPKEWKYNARGVDLNRNFPCSSYCSKVPMEYAGSEKETQLLIHFFQTHNILGYFDLHSRGEVIYHYRNAMPLEYNQKNYELAKKIGETIGYSLGDPKEEIPKGDCGGNTVHYFSEYYKRPSITIETLKDEESFPLDPFLQEEVIEKLLPLFGVVMNLGEFFT